MTTTALALPIVPQNSGGPLAAFATQMLNESSSEYRLEGVLADIEAIAERDAIPIVGRLEGAVIRMLVELQAPQNAQVLDIGTAIGYSAIWLGLAVGPHGRVVSVELDPARAEVAQANVERAGLAGTTTIVVGDVFSVLPELGTFDVVFQDVMKHAYFGSGPDLATSLLNLCVSHLNPGGILLTDNAFCAGRVLEEESEYESPIVNGIRSYNQAVVGHPLLRSVILPVRDGLWVSLRKVSGEGSCTGKLLACTPD